MTSFYILLLCFLAAFFWSKFYNLLIPYSINQSKSIFYFPCVLAISKNEDVVTVAKLPRQTTTKDAPISGYPPTTPKSTLRNFRNSDITHTAHSQRRMDFSSTRALLVGAGGIGCELLKTLCLHNFKHIFIVPLPSPQIVVLTIRLIWIRLTCRIWIDSFCFDINISRNQRRWYVL